MKILFKKISLWIYIKESFLSYFINNNLVRLSKQNELNDYFKLLRVEKNDNLKKLFYEINIVRKDYKLENKDYDYGQGYFYQSVPEVYITGYRNTSERVNALNLKKILKNKNVLDIGSNVGAILFQLDDCIQTGIGIEKNKYLIKISNLISSYLKTKTISFINTTFESFKSKKKFDAILSLANHHTYDGNTKFSIEQYFAKVNSLVSKNGIVVFESHPIDIEPLDQLRKTISKIEIYFEVIEEVNVKMNDFLDKNRTYLILKPRS